MAGPNHIVPITPETQDQLPVGDKMDALTGKVVDRRRRAVMGTLAGLAIAISSPAMAQDMVAVKAEVPQSAFVANTEYDAMIDAAVKAKIDPLEFINNLRKEGKITFEKGREIKKYYAEKVATEDRARIAGKEQAAIDRRSRETQIDMTIESRTASINSTAIRLISSLEKNRKEGTFKKSDLDILKEIYNRPDVRDDVKKMIQEKFGDLFDFRTLIAQA